ncbi:NosD domain-containing protein [Methanococcoides burtonii]|uniref:Cell surface glycoprotein n=1 Tax=Methanococcoides burtonii (strain DSM 6242 / NBRC 107633 / OCM 468 / ACE-M) TaxID=259564 RepID=Q12Z43_METBU|nr:right-handed parallel beta-helix repeat-containing protein [Methanococcoides burtonii]ABE51283.1 Cell surface glycoprotein [Methanococcoides burtonii DSM 6242]
MPIGNIAAKDITVDDDGFAKFMSIDEAVKYSKTGDTIIVYPGTYFENVDVYKEITLVSYSGDPNDTIIQTLGPDAHVLHVTEDNVTISGFTIIGASTSKYDSGSGIYLDEVVNAFISNNIITKNNAGVILVRSENNTLVNNVAYMNRNGISIGDSDHNVLNNNTVKQNKFNGIVLGYSDNNSLINNNASSNYDSGIRLESSNDNELIVNVVNSNRYGFEFKSSFNNTLSDNTVNSNSAVGIYFKDSANNKVEGNLLSKNLKNIHEDSDRSDKNHIYDNEINDSTIGNILFIISSFFVIVLVAVFRVLKDKINTKKLLISLIASLFVSALIIFTAVIFFTNETFRTIAGGYWSYLEIPVMFMIPATPLIYGWITRDKIGSIVVGIIPWFGFMMSIAIMSGSIYDFFSPIKFIELIFYYGIYSIVGGLAGYFASKRKIEYLLIAIVLAMGWITIFLSGID